VIVHVGAKPVFVDVEADTLNLDPQAVAAAITPRTKAIIPVHFAGHPVDLDAIYAIAKRHNLHVIEDAAHGIGASYKGEPIGSRENPTAFSFYATKNLVTGEGGMLTGSADFLNEARIISLHGMSREAWGRYTQGGSWAYDIVLPGFKYNMSDIQSSLGIWQLRKFSVMQHRRREIVQAYQESFSGIDQLELPTVRDDVEHAWHLFVIRLRLETLNIDRGHFIEELKQRNIGTSVHFIPMQKHSYYRNTFGLRLGDYPVTQANSERVISLPLNPTMTDSDVRDVVAAVTEIAQDNRKRRLAA
jgi:dTDP-4-amino-4,6-dideoxygalactose transaminase